MGFYNWRVIKYPKRREEEIFSRRAFQEVSNPTNFPQLSSKQKNLLHDHINKPSKEATDLRTWGQTEATVCTDLGFFLICFSQIKMFHTFWPCAKDKVNHYFIKKKQYSRRQVTDWKQEQYQEKFTFLFLWGFFVCLFWLLFLGTVNNKASRTLLPFFEFQIVQRHSTTVTTI